MLSMKTLRVAIVTMGSALLLGPGLAAAVDIQLDGTGDNAASPVTYATETLPAADTRARTWLLYPDEELDLHVKPRRRIGAIRGRVPSLGPKRCDDRGCASTHRSYVEIADSGTVTAINDVGQRFRCQFPVADRGPDFVVFEVGDVGLENTVGVRLQTNGMLGANSGTFTATISSYSDPDDALDGEYSTSAFGGSATVIRLATGVATTFKPAAAAVASVDTGFMEFAGETPGQAILGWLGVRRTSTSGSGRSAQRSHRRCSLADDQRRH